MIYRLGKMENSRKKLHMTGWNLGRTSYGMLVASIYESWNLKKKKKTNQIGRPKKFWRGGGSLGVWKGF